jgi:hypothetical protein
MKIVVGLQFWCCQRLYFVGDIKCGDESMWTMCVHMLVSMVHQQATLCGITNVHCDEQHNVRRTNLCEVIMAA